MEPLSVAVPWNLPSYISANGFHPLYQALFEDNPRLQFYAVDEAVLGQELERDNALYRALLTRRAELQRSLLTRPLGDAVARGFLRHLTMDGLTLAAEIPGDIELHHTSPLALGERPFVLHCESFLPVFQPFFWQGMGTLKGADAVRAFYAQHFKAKNCLGIFSHIPQTLEQLSAFFGDPEIDAKLHPSSIGISERSLRRLRTPPRSCDFGSPVFLFVSSFHDNPSNLSRRGADAVLIFAERFLRSGRAGHFIFRARRPERAQLVELGLDPDYFQSLEGRFLTWIEDYLPEREQLRLFTLADFVLLPSTNLHSASIIQALAGGAVPVVSDAPGTEVYVEDGRTGIVLRGVRGAVWQADPETGVLVDAETVPRDLAARLGTQMQRRVDELLDNPARFADMRAAGQREVERRFAGKQFRDALSEEIAKLWHDAKCRDAGREASSRGSLLAASGALTASGWERYAASPSQPRLSVDIGAAKVYALRGVYYFVPGGLNADLDPFALNPLTLRDRGELQRLRVRVATRLDELAESMYFALSESTHYVGRMRYYRLRVIDGLKARLRPHRAAYRFARAAYRVARAAVRATTHPFSRLR